MIISRPPTRRRWGPLMGHGSVNDLLLIYATPRRQSDPRVLVFRSRSTCKFITRVDIQMPEVIKFGFKDQVVTGLIQIAELADSAWASSRIGRIEEKPIPRTGPKPKRKALAPPLGFRTFIYSI